MKKMARNYTYLSEHQKAAELLKGIVDVALKKNAPPQVLYSHYNNLFLSYIRTNINTSILFGKALLSDSERFQLPTKYEKLFQLHLGTAYLLKGNYADAKARLKTCINMLNKDDSDSKIMAYALNNLGVAYWWHKHPNFYSYEELYDKEEKD